ncbi:hypothetical protein [Streptomyces sp. Y1]|uniref:Uncharacterized protein n=1 Tax=Streptomyces sp. Y1 TaxID=3238634 RepID=A0AB39TAP7_9ACTN
MRQAGAFLRPRVRAHRESAAVPAASLESNLDFTAEHPVEVRTLT